MPHWNGPQPALLLLRHLIYANLPQIHQIGIYNARNVAGSSKRSLHAEGRAADIYLNAFVATEKNGREFALRRFSRLFPQHGARRDHLESSDLESHEKPHSPVYRCEAAYGPRACGFYASWESIDRTRHVVSHATRADCVGPPRRRRDGLAHCVASSRRSRSGAWCSPRSPAGASSLRQPGRVTIV